MNQYQLVSQPLADLDVEAAFLWYESQVPELGTECIEQLRAKYDRIVSGPFRYQDLRSGIRHALLRRFLYAVLFALENRAIVVLAVLHAGRDAAEWQRRRS